MHAYHIPSLKTYKFAIFAKDSRDCLQSIRGIDGREMSQENVDDLLVQKSTNQNQYCNKKEVLINKIKRNPHEWAFHYKLISGENKKQFF